MIEYRFEYRINKSRCECFRTDSREKLEAELARLRDLHPGTEYTTQSRAARLDRYGVALRDHKGRPQWGPWS